MPSKRFRLGRLAPLAAALVAALGIGVAVAVAAVTESTATQCATTTAPSHTVGVDGVGVATVGGDVLSVCATATATATDQTETVTTTVPGPITTVTTTVGTTTTPAPSGGTPGIAYEDETGNLANVSTPNIYSLMIGGAWSSDVASVIEKIPGRGLVYFDGTDVKQNYSTGVPYTDASANGWLLRDSAGNLMVNTTYGSYCADVGSAGYQQAWVSNVLSYLGSHKGVDGVFIDNVLYDPKGDCGAYPAKYPTTAAWDTAMISFVKAVYTALNASGYYIALNAGAFKSGDTAFNDGTSTVAWWQQLGPYADGLTNEYYDETSDGTSRLRTTGTAWYQDFDSWQRLIGTAQGMGDDFIGLTYGAAGDTNAMTYGKASFLLEWNGGGSAYAYHIKGSSADTTSSAWTASIGTPVGAKVAVGAGYRRTYTGGTVLVNPSPTASQTFTVSGTTYTLAPTTARILTS